MLLSNLKIAFDRDCAALYIASGATTEQVHKELRDFGFSPDYLKSLTIATSHQFYLSDGVFHADRAVKQIRSLIDERANQGFKGLYVSDDAADTFDTLLQDLTEWMHFAHSWGKTLSLPLSLIHI